MKIAINILKVLEIIVCAIWGIIFGIMTPLTLMYGDIVADSIADHYVLWVWLLNSCVFYIAGTFIVMLKAYKVALCFHTAGLIGSIVIYGIFSGIYKGNEELNPAQLYMPVIALFFLTLAITLIANKDKINQKLSETKDKKYEPSPSVLGGEYQAKLSEKEKNQKRKK